MKLRTLILHFLKILFFILYFGVLSLIIEITFFNKNRIPFDYYWIRHLAVFLVLVLSFVSQKKRIHINNLKPYSAIFLFFINMIPGISYLSKYSVLFLSFLLFLYIKSDFKIFKYRLLLRKNMHFVVLFLVLFVLFFPLFLEEDYVYDPLSLFIKLPGYRLSYVAGLEESAGGASDLFDAFLPQWTYTYQSIRRESFPLWQYKKGLGEQLYPQSYHPERLISFVVRPVDALTLRVILKLLLSMTGMFLLLRAIRLRNLICIIGGLAYAFSGYIIGWLFGPQSSPAYHFPFLFYFLISYLESKNKKFLLYFALGSGLTIYSGFIAVAGYAIYAVALFLILYYLVAKLRLIPKMKEALKVSLYWILGILTASFLFIPLYYRVFVSQSFDISYRRIGRVFHLSPEYFANILFPEFHGWKISPEIRPYVSSIIIFFLLVGLVVFVVRTKKFQSDIVEKEKYYILFFLLLIPFLMAMFGLFPFYQIGCQLPVLKSSPLSRLQSLSCFILVILGAKGLEMFIQSYKGIQNFYKKRKFIFFVITGILFLSSVVVAITSAASEKETSYHSIHTAFFLLSAIIIIFQLSVILKRTSAFFLVLLVPLFATDFALQNHHYLPVNRKSHFLTEINTPLINFVKKNSRKYEGVLAFDSNYNTNGTLGNYGVREKIVHQFYHQDHKALIVDTFSPQSFVTATAPNLQSNHTDFSSSFIQLLGVRYLIFRYEFDGDHLPPYYNLVYNQLDGKVYENSLHKKNRGIFFCKPEYFKPEDKDRIIRKIRSMNYSKQVYVEEGQKLNLNCRPNMRCRIRVVEYTPNKIIYRYEANSDGILTFPEAYDQGWSVTVNGRSREVLKTNLLFRGVAIKRGKGLIIFTYHISKIFILSTFVGLGSLLLLIGLYVHSNRLKKPARL